MIFPWRRRVKTYPVPEKYQGMWVTIAKSIDDAQGWLVDAHKAGEEGKKRIYTKMVSDRLSAIGNLQRIIFPNEIEALSRLSQRGTVHTSIEIEPPSMIVFDSDEEFYASAKGFQDEIKIGDTGIAAFGIQRLDKPITPVNPEGAD